MYALPDIASYGHEMHGAAFLLIGQIGIGAILKQIEEVIRMTTFSRDHQGRYVVFVEHIYKMNYKVFKMRIITNPSKDTIIYNS